MSVSIQHRDLLLCSLALEKNLVSGQELEEALGQWREDPGQDLAEALIRGGFISARGHERLQGLIGQSLSGLRGEMSPVSLFESLPPGVRAVLKGARPEIDEDSVDYETIDSSGGPPTTCFTSPPPNTSVSRFHDLRPFAEGGLGEVYLAEDAEVQRTVAVKQIKKRWADDEESRNRFLQEAQITGRLEHPGVVPVYAMGTDETGRPYYAMRFIQGHSLQQAIERFHAPAKVERQNRHERLVELRKLLDRFVDVCNTVDYAHSRGVIHRDLKPSNIMLGAYGETFVVDWGLAKVIDAGQHRGPATIDPFAAKLTPGSTNTILGAALGTPSFMSPEQSAGKHDQLGPTTDVYSLGATLWQILTGESPSGDYDANPESLCEKATWAPPALGSICQKAMARKPEDRYDSARALSDDIQRWQADEHVLAHPDSLAEKVGRWIRNHQALEATLIVVLLAVLVVLIAWLIGDRLK